MRCATLRSCGIAQASSPGTRSNGTPWMRQPAGSARSSGASFGWESSCSARHSLQRRRYSRANRAARPRDPRWLLVVGVPLAVLTAPTLAIDFARFGPQEPLLVGGMSLGAAMLVWSLDRLLEPERPRIAVASIIVVGLGVWALGVTQKETSCCVLLLLPFLWPTLRAQRPRWLRLHRGRRSLLGAIGVGILLPFLPMAVRTIQLALAEERVYSGATAGRGLLERLNDQLAEASEFLHTPLFPLLGTAAIVLLAVSALRRGVDWLAVGFLATAVGFVAFAAASGVVASRYYLPPLVLLGLALARAAVSLGTRLVTVAGVLLIAAGAAQWDSARGWVEWWVEVEQGRETLVRESAARASAGCRVDVLGENVEFVQALPVLMPLADEPPRNCSPGRRVVVVIDNHPGQTPADAPLLEACAPEAEPAWSTPEARIVRCTA